jgi:hypothetical protein
MLRSQVSYIDSRQFFCEKIGVFLRKIGLKTNGWIHFAELSSVLRQKRQFFRQFYCQFFGAKIF